MISARSSKKLKSPRPNHHHTHFQKNIFTNYCPGKFAPRLPSQSRHLPSPLPLLLSLSSEVLVLVLVLVVSDSTECQRCWLKYISTLRLITRHLLSSEVLVLVVGLVVLLESTECQRCWLSLKIYIKSKLRLITRHLCCRCCCGCCWLWDLGSGRSWR